MERPGPGGRDRWPRSYRRRQGNLTRRQRRALAEHWERFGVELPFGVRHSVAHLFGRQAPCTLELGFGFGEVLLARAASEPERDFLGVEVHKPAVGHVLAEIAERGLTNVLLVRADGLRLMNEHLEPGGVDQVCVLHPDPFPRPTEADKRLVRPLLLELLALHLPAGGSFHLATDAPEYGAHAEAVFSGDARFALEAVGERPAWRVPSRYERKGLEADNPSVDWRWSRC